MFPSCRRHAVQSLAYYSVHRVLCFRSRIPFLLFCQVRFFAGAGILHPTLLQDVARKFRCFSSCGRLSCVLYLPLLLSSSYSIMQGCPHPSCLALFRRVMHLSLLSGRNHTFPSNPTMLPETHFFIFHYHAVLVHRREGVRLSSLTDFQALRPAFILAVAVALAHRAAYAFHILNISTHQHAHFLHPRSP